MKIALDYDKTYTLDKPFWDTVVREARRRGHEVTIVTARSQELDNIDDRVTCPVSIIYCNGVAKRWVCHHHHNQDFDVWIDDKPEGIFNNSSASKEILAEWRASSEWLE